MKCKTGKITQYVMGKEVRKGGKRKTYLTSLAISISTAKQVMVSNEDPNLKMRPVRSHSTS